MSTMTIRWQMSDEAMRAAYIATGVPVKREHEFEVELSDLTVEQRAVLIEAASIHMGNPEPAFLKFRAIEPKPNMDGCSSLFGAFERHYIPLTSQPTLDQTLAMAQAQLDNYHETTVLFEQHQALKRAEREEEQAAIERADQAIETYSNADLETLESLQCRNAHERFRSWRRDRLNELRRERAEKAKSAWIAEKGSPRLQQAAKRGYDCQRLYVTERAAIELPRFTVDFDHTADWRSRSCPSASALGIEDEVRALGVGDVRVVWLTKPPLPKSLDYIDYECEMMEFEECEAVVVHYLGRYSAVRIV